MCPPVLAVASLVATVASTAIQMGAAKSAGQAQAAQVVYQAQNEQVVAEHNAQATENIADYNATVAENNALIYTRASEDAIQRGADAAAEQRLGSRQSTARGRAFAGASGTEADTGTNLQLYAQNRQIGEMNALTAMNNAEREAYGYKLESDAEEARARGIRYVGDVEADNTRIAGQVGLLNAQYAGANYRYAGNVNAASTLVTGAAQVGKAGYGYYQDIFAKNEAKRK